jgi:hypothetical protein
LLGNSIRSSGKAEGEQAKTVIQETLRRDREGKHRLIRDVEEWLEEQEE